MYNYTLSLLSGLCAMIFVIISYFVRKKSLYLLFQALCIVCLISSYFFNVQFFAMIGLGIGLCRALIFFAFEKRDKDAPIWLAWVVSIATVVSYYIVNFVVLKQAQVWDVLCMLALVMYAFIFRLRDLKTVRFTMLAPTALTIVFNIATHATLFVTLSYVFELGANLISIYKYHIRKDVVTSVNKNEKEKKYE